jgi:peptide/nickel transport system substrate-binding protein
MPSRRAVLGSVAAGGAALLSGCGSTGSGSDDPVPEFEPEGRTVTAVAPRADGPERFNPYGLNQRGRTVVEPFQQLVLPADAASGAFYTDGHTWTVDGAEVSVTCAVTDYAVESDAVTARFRSDLTYWNGDALDARAFFIGDRLGWLAFGSDGDEFPHELASDTEYRRRFDTDDWAELRGSIHPGAPPLPPSFTEGWIERFESAGSQDARDEVYGDLNAVDVDRYRFVADGYGSGVYRVESENQATDRGLGATAREDHPGDPAVPNCLLRTPRAGQISSLVGSGEVDVDDGQIASQGGDVDPGAVPDSVEQVATYPAPVEGGVAVAFNWGTDHLERLWVRRAVAAALPGERLVANTDGASGQVVTQHSGLLAELAGARLDDSFVEGLHTYSTGADTDTASDWLERAGYTREDGAWYDPSGERFALTMVSGERAGPADTTVENGLAEFGIDVTVETPSVRPTDNFTPRIEGGDWDLTVGLAPGGLSVADHYAAASEFVGTEVMGSPLAAGGAALGTCAAGTEWLSPPETVSVPGEPGALEIEGVDYSDGGTSYRHDAGEDVDVCGAIERLRAPGTSAEARRGAARKCARWYNYALPSFVVAQARDGFFGNTGEFAFTGGGAGRVARPPTWSAAQYHLQAGTIR